MKWKLIVVYLLMVCNAIAQQPFYKELTVAENDQPVAVSTMAQDDNGYLILGTANGVYTYNGRNFVPVTDRKKPVTALCIADAVTYIAYKDGEVTILENGVQRILDTVRATVNSIKVAGDSSLWLCTDTEGIIVYRNGRREQYINTESGLADDYVYELAGMKNIMAAATDAGICLLTNAGKMQGRFSAASALVDNIVRAVCYDAGTHMLVAGAQQGGLCGVTAEDSSAWHIAYCTKDWQWGQVNDIIVIDGGRYWVTTATGKLVNVVVTDTGFIANVVHEAAKGLGKMLLDKGGNIWCATSTGVILFPAMGIANCPLKQPYSLRKVTAMACAGSRQLYAMGKELYAVDSKNEKGLLMATTNSFITAMHTDQYGRLWIGTMGDGIYRYNSGKLQSLDVPGLRNTDVISMSSADDTLWVAGLNGLEKIALSANGASGTIVMYYNKQQGTGSDYVYQIFTDSRKRIWLATDGGGLRVYEHDAFRNVEVPGLNSKVIYSIAEDSDGNIWMAALKDGLFVCRDSKWQRLGSRNGLSDLNISAIASIKDRIVIVHQKGIDAYYPDVKIFRHYTRRLGMDIDSTSSVLNCYGKDTAGNIYIPYEHGFIRFDEHRPLDIRPGIHIMSVNLFLKPIAAGRSRFAASENYLTFVFGGVNFTNPDRLFYRYRLTGFNNEWVTTNDESATFPQLPPGTYTFVVQSSLSAAFDDSSEASYTFFIARPVWQRPWFVIGSVLIVAMVVVVYFRYRVKKLERISLLEKERHLYEYEYLKGQVNPHFLFNSLNTVVSLIDEDARLATDYTIHLSDFYRNMLAHNDKDLITVAQEWELLEKYIYIQKSRFGEALKVELVSDDRIMQSVRIIPMALQLLVENAIKHNVVSQLHPLHVVVTVTDSAISVQNNIQIKKNKEKGTGIGLGNLKRRYALYDKTIQQYTDEKSFFVKLPAL